MSIILSGANHVGLTVVNEKPIMIIGEVHIPIDITSCWKKESVNIDKFIENVCLKNKNMKFDMFLETDESCSRNITSFFKKVCSNRSTILEKISNINIINNEAKYKILSNVNLNDPHFAQINEFQIKLTIEFFKNYGYQDMIRSLLIDNSMSILKSNDENIIKLVDLEMLNIYKNNTKNFINNSIFNLYELESITDFSVGVTHAHNLMISTVMSIFKNIVFSELVIYKISNSKADGFFILAEPDYTELIYKYYQNITSIEIPSHYGKCHYINKSEINNKFSFLF